MWSVVPHGVGVERQCREPGGDGEGKAVTVARVRRCRGPGGDGKGRAVTVARMARWRGSAVKAAADGGR